MGFQNFDVNNNCYHDLMNPASPVRAKSRRKYIKSSPKYRIHWGESWSATYARDLCCLYNFCSLFQNEEEHCCFEKA